MQKFVFQSTFLNLSFNLVCYNLPQKVSHIYIYLFSISRSSQENFIKYSIAKYNKYNNTITYFASGFLRSHPRKDHMVPLVHNCWSPVSHISWNRNRRRRHWRCHSSRLLVRRSPRRSASHLMYVSGSAAIVLLRRNHRREWVVASPRSPL